MQGHLLKMADPSYISKKTRPSKYDKQIERQSLNWCKADLQQAMRLFGELQLDAKSKDPFLFQKLKNQYLQVD